MADEKNEKTPFTTTIDKKLRLDARAVALKEGMSMKVAVERLFRLYVEAGSLETLEKAYQEYIKDKKTRTSKKDKSTSKPTLK